MTEPQRLDLIEHVKRAIEFSNSESENVHVRLGYLRGTLITVLGVISQEPGAATKNRYEIGTTRSR